MEWKIRLMLAIADGADAKALRGAMIAEAARLDAALPGRLRHARAFRLHDEALREAARGSVYSGAPPFDAMMEIVADDGEAIRLAGDVLEGVAGRMAGVLRPENSAVLAGTIYEILPGTGPVHLAISARRLPHLSHDDYMDHWFHKHSDKARSADQVVQGLFYRQFHNDPARAAGIARRAGIGLADFDGMSEAYFTDGETLSRVYNAPGVWEAALTDELRFVDHGRSILSLLQMDEAT